MPPMSFFPKADAAVLATCHEPPPPPPVTVGPVFDPDNADKPIKPWCQDADEACYLSKNDDYAPAPIPDRPECHPDRYLRPLLAKDERLRLSMLWYYTRGILNESELLSGLQEKAHIAQETTGWDCAIIGILDVNFYIRLATVGVPLAILPRGEATCAHTIHQPSNRVFLLPDLEQDWRFQLSPNVELGGLRAYAGVPLRVQHESGRSVHIGSLCVASTKTEAPLSKAQQQSLARLADWVVSDIVQYARARRQREGRRMAELVSAVHNEADNIVSEEAVMKILRTAYPDAKITLRPLRANQVEVEGRDPISWSDFQDGLWEDADYINDFIVNSNHKSFPDDRVVRIIAAQCESVSGPSILSVASRDFQLVPDDVDSWFIHGCAGMISKIWHKRLLTEAMKAKEKFLRGFSHQLRTPIHGILGSVELLAEELKSASKSLQAPSESNESQSTIYLDTIKTAGRDLISIVNSMITLNRWADIAMAERRSAIHSMAKLESELIDELRKNMSGDRRYMTSLVFNHRSHPDSNSICIDLGLLRDSLLPIIVNAIQNTPKGLVMVSTSMLLESNELVIDVEDTGYGIKPDDQTRIFEPYEKVNTHSTGAGLGLTLASKFAGLLHGSVDLESSTFGRGSHFRATFREVKFTLSPSPAKPFVSKFSNIPPKFYKKAIESDKLTLCHFFGEFLISQGFTASDETETCFLIMDFVPNVEQHSKRLAEIPAAHVAICLVPDSECSAQIDDNTENVVYLRGIYLTSIMVSALEEVDKRFSIIKASSSGPLGPAGSSYVETDDKSDEKAPSDIPPLNAQHTQSLTDRTVNSSTETNKTQPSPSHSELPLQPEMDAPLIPALPRPSKPRALLVDDNAINLRIMQMYCNKRGLSYHCATDGSEAVEIFFHHQTVAATGEGEGIQLILMDLQMPVCDGIEATRQIRDLEKKHNWESSTVFIVTGQDSPKDRAAAEGVGAHEYFVKPVGIKTLDRGVKQHFPTFKGA